MKVLILQGLLASVKSTIAKELVINKNYLRAMMYGSVFSKRSKKIVCSIRDKIIDTILKAGGNVVDTNFNPKHIAQIKNIVRNYDAEVCLRERIPFLQRNVQSVSER